MKNLDCLKQRTGFCKLEKMIGRVCMGQTVESKEYGFYPLTEQVSKVF